MKRVVINWAGGPDGYGDARVDGSYAVQRGVGIIQTHTGDLRLEGDTNLLFIRLPYVGKFRIAGKKQHSDANGAGLEWDGSQWTVFAPAPGNNPVIYLSDGIRCWVTALNSPSGALGWRYVADNGALVSCAQSYADSARAIFEFTTKGDVTIGQGQVDGCIALADGKRYLLEPGHCRFINMDRQGDRFAVTIVKLLDKQTVIYWFSRSELAGFPQQLSTSGGTSTQPPAPNANPGTTPNANPQEPPPVPEIPNCKDILDATWAAHPVERERMLAASAAYEEMKKAHGADAPETKAKEPALSEAKGVMCDIFATACAKRDARFGQRLKKDGTNHRRADGVYVSTDVLLWKEDGKDKFHVIDMLSDNSYGWSINPTDFQPSSNWVAALPDASAPAPQPEPVPDSGNTNQPPSKADLTAVLALLHEQDEQIHHLTEAVEDLRGRLDELEGTAARKGQPISITGSVGISDVISSKKVTWSGTL